MKRGRNAVEGNIVQYVKELERRISALERQEAVVNELSELGGDLGDVSFGNLAGRLNGDGVSLLETDTFLKKYSYKFLDSTDEYIGGIAYVNNEVGLENVKGSTNSYVAIRGRSAEDKAAQAVISAQRYLNSKPAAYVQASLGSDGVGAIEIAAGGDSGTIKINPNSIDNDTIIYSDTGAVLTVDAGDNDIDIATKMNFGNTGVLTGGSATLNDDAATSFTPVTPQGMMLFASTIEAGALCGILVYNTATPTTYLIAPGANTAVTTGALAGTTGADNKYTVSCHTDGKIYLENRRGGARTVRWQILAGTVS